MPFAPMLVGIGQQQTYILKPELHPKTLNFVRTGRCAAGKALRVACKCSVCGQAQHFRRLRAAQTSILPGGYFFESSPPGS